MTEQVHGWVLHESNEKKKNDFTKMIKSSKFAKVELESYVRYGEQVKAKTSSLEQRSECLVFSLE